MKEIEKLQHRQTSPSPSRLFLPPLRHRLTFPLIDFFFPSFPSSLLQPPPSPSPDVSLLPPPLPLSSQRLSCPFSAMHESRPLRNRHPSNKGVGWRWESLGGGGAKSKSPYQVSIVILLGKLDLPLLLLPFYQVNSVCLWKNTPRRCR